ncbi:MAG: hypothetical protein AABX90_01335 [Nanoarchaeota archaeon]
MAKNSTVVEASDVLPSTTDIALPLIGKLPLTAEASEAIPEAEAMLKPTVPL